MILHFKNLLDVVIIKLDELIPWNNVMNEYNSYYLLLNIYDKFGTA